MKKLTLALVTGAVLLVNSMAVMANGTKIGVVDLRSVIQQAPQTEKIADQIKAQFKGREDKVQAAQKAMQADASKLQKNASVMKASDKKALEAKLMKERTQVQEQQLALLRDLRKAQDQAMQKFMTQVNSVISQVSKQQHLDLVLQKQAVAFSSDNVDITGDVVSALKKSN